MSMEIGYSAGEICNRDGCEGIICEHEKEGSCRCHISPPCSYCEYDNNYCPECDWQGREDQISYKTLPSESIERYKKETAELDEFYKTFWLMYRGKKEIEKLVIIHQSHTHFSQKLIGVFPKGTETRESIMEEVIGTFGGRFESFTETSFSFIEYTD